VSYTEAQDATPTVVPVHTAVPGAEAAS